MRGVSHPQSSVAEPSSSLCPEGEISVSKVAPLARIFLIVVGDVSVYDSTEIDEVEVVLTVWTDLPLN